MRFIDATDIAKQIADFKRVVNSPNSDYMTGYLCALSVTEGMIAKTPTADAEEVRHGRWIKHKENCLEYRCSVCEYEFCRKSNFCSNCGAKMDGKRSEENEG